MALAITTTTDVGAVRVGVSISGGTDGPLDVWRVHEVDGSRYLVRGMSAVSGGVAFGWDYETPIGGEAFHYEAGSASSAPLLLATDRCLSLLTIPGLPSMGGSLQVQAKPRLAFDLPSVSLSPAGRDTRIVIKDVRKSAEFALAIRTKSAAEFYALKATLDMSATMLLRMPGTVVTNWCYVEAGATDPDPVVGWKRLATEADGAVSEWYDWTLPCQVVSQPPGGVFGDPTASYGAIVSAGLTYAQLRDRGTYLDILRGVA